MEILLVCSSTVAHLELYLRDEFNGTLNLCILGERCKQTIIYFYIEINDSYLYICMIVRCSDDFCFVCLI